MPTSSERRAPPRQAPTSPFPVVAAFALAFATHAAAQVPETGPDNTAPPSDPALVIPVEPVVQSALEQLAPGSAREPDRESEPDAIPFEVVVAPLPAPTPDPAAQAAALLELFRAVADSKIDGVRAALASGANPNGEMPSTPPADIVSRFRNTAIEYVIVVAKGVTPLMLAACKGDREVVELLLKHGANRAARTKRHGTTAVWLAGYFGHVEVMQLLLGVEPDSEAARTRVEIDLAEQTARIVRDEIAGDAMPISSGRRGFATPKGQFVVTDKHRQWRSTLYHASMPFFMRLSGRDFGMHAGYLPGYPASHGCIRLGHKHAQELFSQIPIGTRVVIK